MVEYTGANFKNKDDVQNIPKSPEQQGTEYPSPGCELPGPHLAAWPRGGARQQAPGDLPSTCGAQPK